MLLTLVIAATVANAKAATPASAAVPAQSEAPAAAAATPEANSADSAAAAVAATDIPKSIRQARRTLIRLQVLLDRAHFSPGVIDGRAGGNLTAAIDAYAAANGLPAATTPATLIETLTANDAAPVIVRHTITAEQAQGPYLDAIPKDYEDMAKLKSLAYTSPREALAEAFHMDEALLVALNPRADFGKAGTVIIVASVRSGKLDTAVQRLEVDKTRNRVTAFDASGKVVAAYPATVGSTERPAPEGDWAVRAIAAAPTYTYDPTRLTFGKVKTKLTIAAGPNNPVGATWIDLTKDTYGIHGTPDPRLVGKRASNGCVRLTNWDVRQLGASLAKGAAVKFVGVETRAKT